MKVRLGFVSNSSSSSFVVIGAGGKVLFEDGDSECLECCGTLTIPIDDMIAALMKAKENGATEVNIDHGGGYEG